MTQYYFRKVWNNIGEAAIVVFEQGQFGQPVCIIECYQVPELIKEYKDEMAKETLNRLSLSIRK